MTRGQDTGRVDRNAVHGAAGRNGGPPQDQVEDPGTHDDEIRVLHYSPEGDGAAGEGTAEPPSAHEPDHSVDEGDETDAARDEIDADHAAEDEPTEAAPAARAADRTPSPSRAAAAGAVVVTTLGNGPSTALVRRPPEHDDRPRRWPLAAVFGVGLLVGAVLLGLVWGTTALIGHDDSTAAAGTSATPAAEQPTVLGTETSRPSPSGAASPVAAAAAVSTEAACARVVAARGKALEAARPAMDQWAVHIGAMNKLVVGAITLAQANAFWAQTRLGAITKIRDFQTADDQARSLTVACPPASVVHGAAVAGCAKVAEQQAAALGDARAAVRTWKHHVNDMEMLRMGHLSPAAATKMWLASWHRGVDQLRAYNSATNRIGHPTCAG